MTRKELKKKLKPYWKAMKVAEDLYYSTVMGIEENMRKQVGIDDLEFFGVEMNGYCGIGSEDRRLKLIHDYELEEEDERKGNKG